MRMTFIIVGAVIALVVTFSFIQAHMISHIHIQKTITINGTKQNVFNMVRYLENFPKWSPFLAQDSTQKYRIEGKDGFTGAKYHWEGNQGKDLGYQQIVKIKNLEFIGMQCNIQKPFTAQPTFDYTFSGQDGNITVVQDFNLQSPLIDAFFMWLFGAKKQMEKTNEQGLQLLKKVIEN